MDNTIYKRQFAVLMFILTFTFKVSKLPPLVAESVGSGGTFLVFLYLVLEAVTFFIVYRFVLTGGFESIRDTVFGRCLALVLAANFIIKFAMSSSGIVIFALDLMFESIPKFEVVFAIIIPATYAAYKGIRGIARAAEFLIWLIMFVLIVNLVFLKGSLDFTRNLPLMGGDISQLLSDGDAFFYWFGDFVPLMFVRLKSSKRNYVGVSFAASFLMVILAFVLMFAMYGAAAPYVSNFIVEMASFNQFADKLGRLDWTGMIVWIFMAMIVSSVYLWAFAEAGEIVTKKRRPWVLLGGAATAIALSCVKDASAIIDFLMGNIRWFAAACNYVVPLLILIYSVARRKTEAVKARGEEVNDERLSEA